MVTLQKVTRENVWDVLDLHVSPEQENFVSPTFVSLAQAYLVLSEGGHVFPFAICDDNTPVGFLMVGYDGADFDCDPPEYAKGSYCLWRFLIDERHQKKGYGTKALGLMLDFVRSFPCGKAESCYVCYKPWNPVAKALYARFGFVENGEMSGDESVAVVKL